MQLVFADRASYAAPALPDRERASASMEVLKRYFLPWGRIGRATWLARLAVLAATCAAFGLLLQRALGENALALAAALFLWGAACVTIKRLHDVGHGAWSLLLLVIPILGPVWVIVQALRDGMTDANAYGRDPGSRRDYLQVDIAR